jgi:phospholipase/carboxylesterase
LSTYLPIAEKFSAEASAANRDVPIFMAHGSYDPIVPLARAEESRALLQSLGYAVQWREFPMPHSVCAEEVAEIGAWLSKVLGVGA